MDPLYPATVTVLTLLLYALVTMNCGRLRGRHAIMAPATTGNTEYECAYRVQMNTLEHMAVFLPAMWLFAWSISTVWAAVIGSLWIVGRIIYAVLYMRSPEKRYPGLMIAFFAQIILLIGALIGIGILLFA